VRRNAASPRLKRVVRRGARPHVPTPCPISGYFFAGCYPGAPVNIEGHSDGKGADAYNQTGSEKGAASIAQWLVAKEGANAAQPHTRGSAAGRLRDTLGRRFRMIGSRGVRLQSRSSSACVGVPVVLLPHSHRAQVLRSPRAHCVVAAIRLRTHSAR